MNDNVNALLTELHKTYGRGVIVPASDLPEVRRIKSSIPMYNYISGGGLPINRITEHYGDYSSLKSYTAYDFLAKFQRYDWQNHEENAFMSVEWKPIKTKIGKKGQEEQITVMQYVKHALRRGYVPAKPEKLKRAALVDVEGTYDPAWGETFGIDNEALLYMSPESMAEAVDTTEALLCNEDVSLVVFDSFSAVGADTETDKSMEDEQMAINARWWNKAMRKFQAAMNRNPDRDITLLVINSAYEKVGFVMGDPEKVKNGGQLKLAKALSIRFRALKEIVGKDEDENEITIGRNIVIKCMKNKTARPFLNATFYFSFINDGSTKAGKTDIEAQIIELGIRFGMIERAGAWYEYDKCKVNGVAAFQAEMIKSAKIKKLSEQVYAKITEKHTK
jgi:RecA/RadA recombinase